MDVIATAMVKIAEISLHGLAPETVLGQMAPAPPMETSGLARATAILTRYKAETGAEKVAAPRVPTGTVPGMNTLSGAKDEKKERSTVDQGKSLGAHVIGGAASGRILAQIAHGPTPHRVPEALRHRRDWRAMTAGAAIGGGEFARKRLTEKYRAHKEKTSAVGAIMSPKIALKASQQTGKIMTGIKKGPALSLKSQVTKF